MYAIIDVETSGMTSTNCKITDIAIIIHDGEKIVDEYQSLVNPERKISRQITQLTGIDNEMIRHAPKFFEIAKKVFQMTEDMVFVAHNVSFDYRIIRKEFEELGGEFVRKQLCTVRTSRRLLPGSKSYSLGKLCSDLAIPITQRHRAYGDALATAKLFDILLDKSKEPGKSLWPPPKKKKKEAVIPPLLSRSIYDNLPTQTGVYHFHDKDGNVIYVGKAKNIKQRILSHFHDKGRKEIEMCGRTANVTYEITGSELIALLLESSEIKSLLPRYNHSQKRLIETHALFEYTNQSGIRELRLGKTGKVADPIITFYTQRHADRFLREFVEKYILCPRYTGLEKTSRGCFSSKIKLCFGVCCDQENVQVYNERLEKALSTLEINSREYVIIDSGRHKDENAIVHLNQDGYQGFGYVSNADAIEHFEEFLQYIEMKDDNSDSREIIRNALANNKQLKIIERN